MVERKALEGQQAVPPRRDKAIEATRLVLLDAAGNPGASIAMDDEWAGLAFFNAFGRKVATLGTGEGDGTVLCVYGPRQERVGARLEIADGAVHWSLVGGPGTGSAYQVVDRDGSRLVLFDNHSLTERVRVWMDAEAGGITMRDLNKKVRIFMGFQEGPKLVINDQEQRILFIKP
jgi:hypothetical protein